MFVGVWKLVEAGLLSEAEVRLYREMASKYGLTLQMTKCSTVPGMVIYEDNYQVAVVDSRHEGSGFTTVALSENRTQTGSPESSFVTPEGDEHGRYPSGKA